METINYFSICEDTNPMLSSQLVIVNFSRIQFSNYNASLNVKITKQFLFPKNKRTRNQFHAMNSWLFLEARWTWLMKWNCWRQRSRDLEPKVRWDVDLKYNFSTSSLNWTLRDRRKLSLLYVMIYKENIEPSVEKNMLGLINNSVFQCLV